MTAVCERGCSFGKTEEELVMEKLLSRARKIIDGVGCVESAEEVRRAKQWLQDYQNLMGAQNKDSDNG